MQLWVAVLGWSGGVVEGDLPAGEMLKFADQLPGSAVGMQTVVEVDAEVGEASLRVPEQVVGDGEDLVADGDQRAFFASSLA